MGGGNRSGLARQAQGQPLAILAVGLDPDRTRGDGAGLRTLGAGAYRRMQVGQAQEALIVRPLEPFRRDPPDPLTARRVDLERTRYRPVLADHVDLGHPRLLSGVGAAQRCSPARRRDRGEQGPGRPGRRGIAWPARAGSWPGEEGRGHRLGRHRLARCAPWTARGGAPLKLLQDGMIPYALACGWLLRGTAALVRLAEGCRWTDGRPARLPGGALPSGSQSALRRDQIRLKL